MNVTTNNFIYRITRTSFAGIFGAFILLPACDGTQKDETSHSNDESVPSTSSMTDTSTTSSGTSSESSDTDSPPMNMCPPHPDFHCQRVGYDCENVPGPGTATFWECGVLNSPLDQQGCLRPKCLTHQDCAIGTKCFNDDRCNENGCTASGMNCVENTIPSMSDNWVCGCSGADDCSGEYGWCVPEAIYECPLEESTETSTPSDATGSSSSGGTEAGTSSESTN